MKLRLLGVYGPYPSKANGACSCYLVESGDTRILLDLGSGGLSKAMSLEDFDKIDNIFLSHFHFDHTSDMLPLHYYAEGLGKHYNVICPTPENAYAETLLNCRCFTPTFIEDGMELEIGVLKLKFFKMQHTVPTYGVRISDGEVVFAYTSDTVMNDNVLTLCKDADLILLDASRPMGFKGPHMTVEDAKMLKSLYNSTTIVTHLSPEYNPKDELLQYDISVAEVDRVIEVSHSSNRG